MKNKDNNSVPFDPGFSGFYPVFVHGLIPQADLILKLKARNQIKFQLQMLEKKLIAPYKIIKAIYYGCVVYGSIIASKYSKNPAIVEGNPFKDLDPTKQINTDLTSEVNSLLSLYTNLNSGMQHHLNKKSYLPEDFEDYANLYIEFIMVNDQFKDLETTDQIVLPSKTEHFKGYKPQKLGLLEKKVFEIIESKNLEDIFNIC